MTAAGTVNAHLPRAVNGAASVKGAVNGAVNEKEAAIGRVTAAGPVNDLQVTSSGSLPAKGERINLRAASGEAGV